MQSAFSPRQDFKSKISRSGGLSQCPVKLSNNFIRKLRWYAATVALSRTPATLSPTRRAPPLSERVCCEMLVTAPNMFRKM